MPAPLHYLQFSHREWLSSSRVRRMTPAAKGMYIDLICYQWEDESIPATPADIAELLGLRTKEVEAVWKHLDAAFPLCEDGVRRNPRVQRDRDAATEQIAANRRNGSAPPRDPSRPRGRPRKPEENPPVPEMENPNKPPGFSEKTEPKGSKSKSNTDTETTSPTNAIAIVEKHDPYKLVEATLSVVHSSLGAEPPSEKTIREYLSRHRGLLPLAEEFGPVEAASLYVWASGFPGGRSWKLIYDQRLVFRKQKAEGFVPGAARQLPARAARPSVVDQVREASAVVL